MRSNALTEEFVFAGLEHFMWSWVRQKLQGLEFVFDICSNSISFLKLIGELRIVSGLACRATEIEWCHELWSEI